jgi:hypothetical protein
MVQRERTIPRGVGILGVFRGPRTTHRTEVRSMDQLRGCPVNFAIQAKNLRRRQWPRRRAFPQSTARIPGISQNGHSSGVVGGQFPSGCVQSWA